MHLSIFALLTSLAVASAQKPYTLGGNCAMLPADRATEFHGNPVSSNLKLAMAGNQWVVFDHFLAAFNQYRADLGEDMVDLDAIGHSATRTLQGLSQPGADYFVELIPPGQERDQIKSGCMLLGNDDERNFLPMSIVVDFDVFTSTNYNLMQDLAANGFVSKAVPYIKNQLTLMTDVTNSQGIGVPSDELDESASAVLKLLSPDIRVSQVDHINEGIHRGINAMYQRMDEHVRMTASDDVVSQLDALLLSLQTPEAGSPAATREGISTEFDLSLNPACFYEGHESVPDGTLKLCEFAVLNKANTHETRVHHVETPERILAGESDVGPVWISELQLAKNNGDEVSGYQPMDEVNRPVVYSVAFLNTITCSHTELATKFVEFLLSEDGQQVYLDGGFVALDGTEMGEAYSLSDDGSLIVEPLSPDDFVAPDAAVCYSDDGEDSGPPEESTDEAPDVEKSGENEENKASLEEVASSASSTQSLAFLGTLVAAIPFFWALL
ncbi:Molybdenum ABC transporter periplasmic molybdate-binding protein [Seminavis robusta]|uniref:Molybdenum ABC transporter periplasmic molybdate-binding protein n=1 Tax=Seminavis robusta TaxID=568900 RepID=A0A9N8DB48_9STRA|nr:Molybdenum ABC transporter periplasmic molybdate-binding protein [Seminavis robusta]|eukprot:Sro20_g014390.1 Molybdenum ABC transporter periplasmic molybdate-binding protein (497) ;mRNA; f:156909-158399